MKNPTADDWRRLGDAVKRARVAISEYRDMRDWAGAVGRSSRVLLGLERGEPVGKDTLLRIEGLLHWEPERSQRVLHGLPEPESNPATTEDDLTRRMAALADALEEAADAYDGTRPGDGKTLEDAARREAADILREATKLGRDGEDHRAFQLHLVETLTTAFKVQIAQMVDDAVDTAIEKRLDELANRRQETTAQNVTELSDRRPTVTAEDLKGQRSAAEPKRKDAPNEAEQQRTEDDGKDGKRT